MTELNLFAYALSGMCAAAALIGLGEFLIKKVIKHRHVPIKT